MRELFDKWYVDYILPNMTDNEDAKGGKGGGFTFIY